MAPELVLVVPRPDNPLTGGHLYNTRVAEASAGAIVIEHVGSAAIDAWLEQEQPAAPIILLDSLYFAHVDARALARRCAREDCALLWLVHFLPDMAPGADIELEARVTTALGGATACIATSQYSARLVGERVGQQRVRVVVPGVDAFPARASHHAASTAPRILTVANFEERKGHLDLLEALAEVGDLDFRWDVVGDEGADAGLARRFHDRVREAGLDARVHVHGRLPVDHVRLLMQEAELFALMSRYEPYGMVYAESLSAGTPVLAWRSGGVIEIVDDGRNGILVEPFDRHALRDVLRSLLEPGDRLGRMQAALLEAGPAFPSWRVVAFNLVAQAREVVASTRRKPLADPHGTMTQHSEAGTWDATWARAREVNGWLTEGEGRALFEAALAVAASHASAAPDAPPPRVVEIGSFFGRSTLCLAGGLASATGARLYAIDPHIGSPKHEVQLGCADTYPHFVELLARHGLEDLVTPLRATSLEARRDFEGPIDLLFIDGSHSYEDVAADFAAWFPLLRVGGTVAFHDSWHMGGVRRASNEVLRRSREVAGPRLVDTITLLQKVQENDAATRRRNRRFALLRNLVGPAGFLRLTYGGTRLERVTPA